MNPEQIEQIELGRESGVDVEIYNNPDLSAEQMKHIRYGLEKGIKAELYAFPDISPTEMQVMCQKLMGSKARSGKYKNPGEAEFYYYYSLQNNMLDAAERIVNTVEGSSLRKIFESIKEPNIKRSEIRGLDI